MKPPVRYLLLLVLLGLQGLTLAAILLSSRHNTEVVLRSHAEESMAHLSTTAADNSRRFLAAAERAATLSAGLIEKNVLSLASDLELESYFLDQLRANPELAGIYLAQEDGSFLLVERDGEGFFTKRIVIAEQRKVLYRYRDATLIISNDEAHPEDDYDPRERPWYREALQEKARIWSEPYIFFTSQRPGITVAKPAYQKDGTLLAIVGVDIEIAGLSAFLKDVPLSANGSAFMMTRGGEVIASPDVENSRADEQTALPNISALGGAAQGLLSTIGTQKLASLDEHEFVEFKVNEQPFYGSLSPFDVGDGTWLVGVVAPSSDFIGSIATQNRHHLWQLLGIGLLSCLLAVPLVFGVTRPLTALYERATRDALTSLPNRSEFVRRAETMVRGAKRSGQRVALAMLDLDGFKEVNDRYGHSAGDKVLEVVAKRMSAAVRKGDLVGRYGGDEFAVLLLDVDEEEASHLVERIRASVGQEPIRGEDAVYQVGASAGVAVATVEESVLNSLTRADKALLTAKSSGKNRTLVLAFP